MTDDLATLLRDRVAGEHLDLDVLTRAATTQGMRIRRRRRAGLAAGAVAAVALVAAGATGLAGLRSTHPSPESASWAGGGGATEPASGAPSPVALPSIGARITLPSGKVATVLDPDKPIGDTQVVKDDDPRPILLLQTMKPMSEQDRAYVVRTYPGTRLVGHAVHPGHLRDTPPVEVTATGWSCEWYVEDDKGACTGPHGYAASLVWRSISDRDSFAAKSGEDGYYLTEGHGGLFVAVQPAPGVPQAEVQRLGRSLTWVD